MSIRAKCLNCGDVVETAFRHDFNTCSCYIKSNEQISNWAKENGYGSDALEKDKAYWDYVNTHNSGIFLDGYEVLDGKEYYRAGGKLSDILILDKDKE